MSNPPPEALQAALSTLALAYSLRESSLTYGGDRVKRKAAVNGHIEMSLDEGAPSELECSADASTAPHHIYAILLTFAGAAVAHCTKKIGIAVGSTHDAENLATVKASELVIFARLVLSAFGRSPHDKPTTILTDNQSNQKVSQRAQSSAHSRYYLVRAACLHERIANGEVCVQHVSDPAMPADFLTKFVSAEKTAKSVSYATGKKS